jgi:hypothetical protein
VLEKYCLECDEVRILLPIGTNGMCPYCAGSPRDCECLDICGECESDLV